MTDKLRGPNQSPAPSPDDALDLSLPRDEMSRDHLLGNAVLESSSFDQTKNLVSAERKRLGTDAKLRLKKNVGVPSVDSLESPHAELTTSPSPAPRTAAAPETTRQRAKRLTAVTGSPPIREVYRYQGTLLDRLISFVANLLKAIERMLMPKQHRPQQKPVAKAKVVPSDRGTLVRRGVRRR